MCVWLVLIVACGWWAPAETDSDAPPPSGPCLGGTSTPLLLSDGRLSGFERCEDGTIHRVTAEPTDEVILPACAGDDSEHWHDCYTDADCTAGPNGRCRQYTFPFDTDANAGCECLYPCSTDADCGPQQVCFAASIGPHGGLPEDFAAKCVPADCRVDADCGSETCGLSQMWSCHPSYRVACRTRWDECRTDLDCVNAEGPHCAAVGRGFWECVDSFENSDLDCY